jgi:hypothetical protein
LINHCIESYIKVQTVKAATHGQRKGGKSKGAIGGGATDGSAVVKA